MSDAENIVYVKPTFNVYTAMMFISTVALGIGAYFTAESLFTPGKNGYGLKTVEQLWEDPMVDKKKIDATINVVDEDKINDIKNWLDES